MIGELRELINFEVRTDVTDAGGGRSTTWGSLTQAWAKIQPVKGGETAEADKVEKQQTYLVTIRYRTDINTKMRINWGGVILNIRSIENRDMKKRFIIMECTLDA